MQSLLRNIEIKARTNDLARCRKAAESIGAVFQYRMRQIDTYFVVKSGRLKLREIFDESGAPVKAELIWYQRDDRAAFRDSQYLLTPTNDPDGLKRALSAGCGIRGEVAKTRDLLLYHNVRIHLDRVEKLGDFVEFEAVMQAGESDERSRDRLSALHTALKLSEADWCATSYSDLLGI